MISLKALITPPSRRSLNVFFSTQSNKIGKSWSTVSQINNSKKVVKFQNKKIFNLSTAKTTFGIGNSSIEKICKKFGLNNRIHILKCKLKTTRRINNLINKLTFKRTLKNKIIRIRKFSMEELKNYKGIRYELGYPIRGQRTHTNAKTRKKLQKNKKYNFLT